MARSKAAGRSMITHLVAVLVLASAATIVAVGLWITMDVAGVVGGQLAERQEQQRQVLQEVTR